MKLRIGRETKNFYFIFFAFFPQFYNLWTVALCVIQKSKAKIVKSTFNSNTKKKKKLDFSVAIKSGKKRIMTARTLREKVTFAASEEMCFK